MDTADLYKCLSDESRLRMLNLLRQGPLCGCHLMEALELDQVKVSKQLKCMKQLGLLSSEREANWMIYRLAEPVHPLLQAAFDSWENRRFVTLPLSQDERKLAGIKRRISRQLTSDSVCAVPSAVASTCCP